jgi:hypothetical protein
MDLSIFDQIMKYSNEFTHTRVKQTMIDQIFCECAKYHEGIIDVLYLFEAENKDGYVRVFYNSDFLNVSIYFKDDKIHRDEDKPAVEISYKNMSILVTINFFHVWYKDGRVYRKYGSSVDFSSYFICLRDELPLIESEKNIFTIDKQNDKKLKVVRTWKVGDKNHRIKGPAIVRKNGERKAEYEYYLNGVQFSKKDYYNMMLCIKWIKILRKRVVSRILQNTNKKYFYSDISQLISSYIY